MNRGIIPRKPPIARPKNCVRNRSIPKSSTSISHNLPCTDDKLYCLYCKLICTYIAKIPGRDIFISFLLRIISCSLSIWMLFSFFSFKFVFSPANMFLYSPSAQTTDIAPVAQWIEHPPSKRVVVGSNPTGRV